MFYKEWKPFYEKITSQLDLNFKDDKESATILDENIKNKKLVSVKSLETLIKNKKVIVFGAGPSLEKTIINYKEFFKDKTIICADGATSALLKHNIFPDIIVTDFDGKITDILHANSKGAIVLVHAHGDNIKKINSYSKKFKSNILGTTQIDPADFKNLYNFGGFTDGDRAVFLADHFNAKKIFLAGFDFNESIGKYSFADKKNKEMKLKKLKWCNHLLEFLIKENKNIEFL